MGILHSGLSGGFSNKTGANVGRRVNGQNIVTGLHHPSTKPLTEAQIIQNQRFGLLTQFLSKISPLLSVGFKHFVKKNSPYNAAFKFNYKTATVNEGSGYRVDYPKIIYSKGNVCKPCCLRVAAIPGFVSFSWVPEVQTMFGRVNDRATFLIYNVQKNIFMAERYAALRQDLVYQFAVPADFAGDELHCYMNFNNENGKLTGESVYGGQILAN